MTNDWNPILRSATLFKGIGEQGLSWLAASARENSLADGRYFFRQDEAASRAYLLVSGRVRITQLTAEGNQIILRLISPGDLFGVVAGFGEKNYPASAVADGGAVALSWSAADLLSLMERIPRLGINVAAMLSRRVQELQERLRELATESVERRVARLLLRLVAKAGKKEKDGILIDLRLSRQDLAEMTGTTLFTVTRVLKRWEKSGIVSVGRQKVKVVHPHGLVSVAEEIASLRSSKEDEGRPG